MRFAGLAVLVLMLGGCLGTPELPLLSDVELAEDAPESGLIAPDGIAPETVLQELKSVENVPDVPPVISEPDKPRRGLAALFGRRDKPAKDAAAAVVATEAMVDAPDVTTPTVPVPKLVATDENIAVAAPEPVAEAPRRGLRALFGRRSKPTAPTTESEQIADTSQTDEVDVVVASVDPLEPARIRRQRNGAFGPRRAKSGQFAQVPSGMVLPFGQIGLACGIRGKALGKEVDRFPEGNKSYRLYDSNPAITGPRTHFITGFKDGCPRQFTASLALLDSPVLHEQLLSVKSSQTRHSTAADIAFQKIRAQVCRVSRGQVCPDKRIDQMEKSMAFVTTYERFGGNASWNEILLHNGRVAANSTQTP